MRITKGRIKRLLRTKKQSQKRRHKRKYYKKKQRISFRKKPYNLRIKSLKRMKQLGGTAGQEPVAPICYDLGNQNSIYTSSAFLIKQKQLFKEREEDDTSILRRIKDRYAGLTVAWNNVQIKICKELTSKIPNELLIDYLKKSVDGSEGMDKTAIIQSSYKKPIEYMKYIWALMIRNKNNDFIYQKIYNLIQQQNEHLKLCVNNYNFYCACCKIFVKCTPIYLGDSAESVEKMRKQYAEKRRYMGDAAESVRSGAAALGTGISSAASTVGHGAVALGTETRGVMGSAARRVGEGAQAMGKAARHSAKKYSRKSTGEQVKKEAQEGTELGTISDSFSKRTDELEGKAQQTLSRDDPRSPSAEPPAPYNLRRNHRYRPGVSPKQPTSPNMRIDQRNVRGRLEEEPYVGSNVFKAGPGDADLGGGASGTVETNQCPYIYGKPLRNSPFAFDEFLEKLCKIYAKDLGFNACVDDGHVEKAKYKEKEATKNQKAWFSDNTPPQDKLHIRSSAAKKKVSALKDFCKSLLLSGENTSFSWDIFEPINDENSANEKKNSFIKALRERSIFTNPSIKDYLQGVPAPTQPAPSLTVVETAWVAANAETAQRTRNLQDSMSDPVATKSLSVPHQPEVTELNTKLIKLLNNIFHHINDTNKAGYKIIIDLQIQMQKFLDEVFSVLSKRRVSRKPPPVTAAQLGRALDNITAFNQLNEDENRQVHDRPWVIGGGSGATASIEMQDMSNKEGTYAQVPPTPPPPTAPNDVYAPIEWDSESSAPLLNMASKGISWGAKNVKLCDNKFKIILSNEQPVFLIDAHHNFDLKIKILYTVYYLLKQAQNTETNSEEINKKIVNGFEKREDYKDMPKTYIKKLIKVLSENASISQDIFFRLCMDFCFSYLSTADPFNQDGTLNAPSLRQLIPALDLPDVSHRLFNDIVYKFLHLSVSKSYTDYLKIYYDEPKSVNYKSYIDLLQTPPAFTVLGSPAPEILQSRESGRPFVRRAAQESKSAELRDQRDADRQFAARAAVVSPASTEVSQWQSDRASGASTVDLVGRDGSDGSGGNFSGGAAEERQYSYNINAAMLFNKIDNFGSEEGNIEITRRENEIVADSSRNSIITIITDVQQKIGETKTRLDALYQTQKYLIENNILEPFTVSDANPEEEKEQNINNFNLLILCLYLSRNNIAEMYKDLGLGAQYKYEEGLTDDKRRRKIITEVYNAFNNDIIANKNKAILWSDAELLSDILRDPNLKKTLEKKEYKDNSIIKESSIIQDILPKLYSSKAPSPSVSQTEKQFDEISGAIESATTPATGGSAGDLVRSGKPLRSTVTEFLDTELKNPNNNIMNSIKKQYMERPNLYDNLKRLYTDPTQGNFPTFQLLISTMLTFAFLEVLGDPNFDRDNRQTMALGQKSLKGENAIKRLQREGSKQSEKIATKIVNLFLQHMLNLTVTQTSKSVSAGDKEKLQKIVTQVLTKIMKGSTTKDEPAQEISTQKAQEIQREAGDIAWPLGTHTDPWKVILNFWGNMIKEASEKLNSDVLSDADAAYIQYVIKKIGSIITLPTNTYLIFYKKPVLVEIMGEFMNKLLYQNKDTKLYDFHCRKNNNCSEAHTAIHNVYLLTQEKEKELVNRFKEPTISSVGEGTNNPLSKSGVSDDETALVNVTPEGIRIEQTQHTQDGKQGLMVRIYDEETGNEITPTIQQSGDVDTALAKAAGITRESSKLSHDDTPRRPTMRRRQTDLKTD